MMECVPIIQFYALTAVLEWMGQYEISGSQYPQIIPSTQITVFITGVILCDGFQDSCHIAFERAEAQDQAIELAGKNCDETFLSLEFLKVKILGGDG